MIISSSSSVTTTEYEEKFEWRSYRSHYAKLHESISINDVMKTLDSKVATEKNGRS